jgi:ADP-ribose pyrophosphatase YjhB (NUDIX family)
MAIRNATKAIIIRDGKVLLNKCKGYNGEIYYDMPGGGQQQYETMEEAVVRECLEETGYLVRVIRFAALAEEIHDNMELREKFYDYSHRVHHIFVVEFVDGILHKPTEIDFQQEECQWIDIDDIPLINLRPKQVKENFTKIISSVTPLYLGAIHVN